jgi:hypothetical protein
MTCIFPGLLPEQAQVWLCIGKTPPPNPTPVCSANQQLLVEWQSKETIKTPNDFLKPKTFFMELNIFSRVFSSVKAVTFCSNRSSI